MTAHDCINVKYINYNVIVYIYIYSNCYVLHPSYGMNIHTSSSFKRRDHSNKSKLKPQVKRTVSSRACHQILFSTGSRKCTARDVQYICTVM